MAEQVWINGELVDPAEARVSVFDHGLTVGDGVFETLKAVDGRPFALRRHLARLRHSAAGLGLRIPVDDDTLRAAVSDVLAASALPLARVRITVTGGPSPLGSERGEHDATVVVAAAVLAEAPATTAACTVPWPRNERGAVAGIKTTSYAENVVALAHARERDCTEALFLTTTGLLCEGTGSNVFVGIDGRLVTPPLSSGCLAGVTRALVLQVTTATEEDIPADALDAADEVFLTSTGRDVQGVHRLDGRELAAPGELTSEAASAFAALAAAGDDP
jgi:branched-chain amino acid aminotransferase